MIWKALSIHFLAAAFINPVMCFGMQESEKGNSGLPEVVSQDPIVIGTTLRIQSSIYDSEREINVWVPASYRNGEKTYPVLYLIDGGLEQDFQHIAGLGQLASINGSYEELLIVGVKTENRLMELTSDPKDPRYIRNPRAAGKSDQFFKHLEEEVVPLISARYRTADRRVLMGESLAGLFVLETFLKHADSFTDYVSISPSLWWDDRALSKSSRKLLERHSEKTRGLYLTMANEGGTMQKGLDEVLDALKNVRRPKENKGLTWHYIDRRHSERHATIYHGAALDALRKLLGTELPEPTGKPWYLIEGASPPKPSNEKQ